jgi:hypothetical protein
MDNSKLSLKTIQSNVRYVPSLLSTLMGGLHTFGPMIRHKVSKNMVFVDSGPFGSMRPRFACKASSKSVLKVLS